MGFAEKKVELFQIVANADEELTGKLIAFAKECVGKGERYSAEELAKFHATRQKYATDSGAAISIEDAHAYIRGLKQR